MMELHEIREQIDEIDNELVDLFVKRMKLSEQVAEYKKANNMPIYVPAREQEILQSVAEKAGMGMENYTRILYSMIFELSRSYQRKRNTSTTQLYQTNSRSISKHFEIFPGSDKTGIMMILPYKTGTLYQVLARIYILGINVIKLEYRPIPDNDFKFKFYFDLETSIYSDEFVQLMCELEDLCEDFEH